MADEENVNPFSKLDAIGGRIRSEFDELKIERRPNLRMFQGQYEQKVLARLDKNQSDAYIRLGRIKVNTMDARMFDMLFPSGTEKNWSISATPKPKAPDDVVQQIAMQIAAENQVDVEQVPLELVEKGVKKWADKQAERMSEAISDKLTEGKYRHKGRKVIHSGNLYGTGWMKGVLTTETEETHWQYDEDLGDHVAIHKIVTEPEFDFVPIWDVYPDLSAQSSDINLCDYIYQRHVMGRHHLQKLAKRDDFNGKAIIDYIRSHPDGDAVRTYHEEGLRQIGTEKQQTKPLRNRYELLERWGYISSEWLTECGCEGLNEEVKDDVFGVIWLLGGRVIKAALHPGERSKHIFHKYHFEEDETSMFGFGVPDAIRDTQDLANATIRQTADNAGITAGPQVEVNVDLMDAAHVATCNEIYPFKTWLRRGTGADAQHKAIHITNIDSHVAELIGLFNTFKLLNDEVSNIPSYMHGEGDKGAADTVGGLSMLMGAANITIKDVVANFDDGMTIPFITSAYDWLMMFGENEIKGDMKVSATGSTSLVAREIRSRALGEFQQETANQIDAPYIDRSNMLRERVKALELPEDVLISKDKAEQVNQQIQQMAAQMMAQALAQQAMQDQQAQQAARQ